MFALTKVVTSFKKVVHKATTPSVTIYETEQNRFMVVTKGRFGLKVAEEEVPNFHEAQQTGRDNLERMGWGRE